MSSQKPESERRPPRFPSQSSSGADPTDLADQALDRLEAVIWLMDSARHPAEASPEAWAGLAAILDDCLAMLRRGGRRTSR